MRAGLQVAKKRGGSIQSTGYKEGCPASDLRIRYRRPSPCPRALLCRLCRLRRRQRLGARPLTLDRLPAVRQPLEGEVAAVPLVGVVEQFAAGDGGRGAREGETFRGEGGGAGEGALRWRGRGGLARGGQSGRERRETHEGEPVLVAGDERPSEGLDGRDRRLGRLGDGDVHAGGAEVLDAVAEELDAVVEAVDAARLEQLAHRDRAGGVDQAAVDPVLQAFEVERHEVLLHAKGGPSLSGSRVQPKTPIRPTHGLVKPRLG